jgi:hypothetical protein
MLRFTIEHKYCKMIAKVEGYNIWDALKSNGKDINYWTVLSVEPAE